MDIDERYTENTNLIYEKSIYLIQYPLDEKVGVSYGIIKYIQINKIYTIIVIQMKDHQVYSIQDISNNKIRYMHKESLIKTNKQRYFFNMSNK